MDTINRSITPFINEFLEDKIVLLSGPRQVGKTFLSQGLYQKNQYTYLNYDSEELRKEIMEKSWPKDNELLVLDEIHKMKKWKRWLKGVYDVEGVRPRLLVTGSSRMDTFKKMGDSLAGRHFMLRLLPLSIKEVLHFEKNENDALEKLLEFGGFPEPYLKESGRFLRLWQKSHLNMILRQDLIDLEKVREIKIIEILVQLLQERVGGEINYSSLARDLQVSDHTVKKWISILESLFVIFTVPPYSKKIQKAITKRPKVYFYDISRIKDKGAKLENFVALSLLKRNYFLEDTEGHELELKYLRDKEKREVDFCIVEEGEITHLIEVKESDSNLSLPLKYYKNKLPQASAFQLVHNLKRRQELENIKIESVASFFKNSSET